MWVVGKKQQGDQEQKKIRIRCQHKVKIVDIIDIAKAMTGCVIEECQVTYGEDTITIFLDSGASVEIIVDSIYADIPEHDD